MVANLIRNAWITAVVFCGHFPDGAEKFTQRDLDNETKGQWYLRQILGSANIDAGPLMAFMTGNLSYQIEHHLYPDLPSNRLAEVAVRVRHVCDNYDLPYTTGSFLAQYVRVWRTIAKLSLPNEFLTDTSNDAPETHSEKMFANLRPSFSTTDPATGRRRGLKTAIANVGVSNAKSRTSPSADGSARVEQPL
jgi:linoleoyl-CoA desaturase